MRELSLAKWYIPVSSVTSRARGLALKSRFGCLTAAYVVETQRVGLDLQWIVQSANLSETWFDTFRVAITFDGDSASGDLTQKT